MEVVVEQAQARHRISEPGDVGEARRTAMLRARELGFDETAAGRVGLVVTEAGTNVIKHGGGGEVLVGSFSAGGQVAVEVLAIDRGPGIRDMGRGMTDGFSTSGTPGNGLGAIRRLSGFFDIYSNETGTVLLARIWPEGARPPLDERWRVGAVCLPLEGETVSGDAWGYVHDKEKAVFLMVDGLGHGRLAFEAAQDSIKILRANPGSSGTEIIEMANMSARGTRGAAAAAADVDLSTGVLNFSGLGNISGSLVTRQGTCRSMISSHGVLGASAERKVKAFQYPWDGTGRLVLHSDGLQSRWEIDKYPGLQTRDPGLLAAVLYRDHYRGRDDVSVVVVTAEPA